MSESFLQSDALQQTNFTQLDWAIVAGYLLVSLIIGVVVKKYSTGMANYIGAGRSVGPWLGVATMTGTELGLVTVMYSAENGFRGGFAAFHIALIAGIVTLCVGLTGFIVKPLRETGVLTIPEFYEKRYGRRTRVLGGIVLAFGGILNMGLFLKVGSMFIVGITGLSHEGLALPAVMTTLLALVLIYTVLGGMISVVITDYVQFVLLSAGMILTTVLAIGHLGWSNITEIVMTEMGEKGVNPLAEGEFGRAYVCWMVVLGLVGCAVWPTAIARVLAMESPQAVKKQMTWSSISFAIRFMIPCFWGICAYVFIKSEGGALAAAFFPDQELLDSGVEKLNGLYAMPIFLGRILPAGLIGIISAAMIAAFMSTHDSYLLCWSSVITQDIIAPLTGDRLNEKQRVMITRLLILIIGAYILAWGLFYEGSDAIWSYMAITGAIYFTGAIPILIGGLYWRGASSTGAFCALLAGCSATLGLEPIRLWLGKNLLDDSARASEWFTAERVGIGAIILTVVVFVVVSLCVPDQKWVKGKSTK